MNNSPVIASPFWPSEMRPVYERVCEELRGVVADGLDRRQAAAVIVEMGPRGLVAMTATTVHVMRAVGRLLARSHGSVLDVHTMISMLVTPPAYRGLDYTHARLWLHHWQKEGFQWEDLEWLEESIAEHRGLPVVEALIEQFDWQLALVCLLSGRDVMDGLEDFITDWLAWEG